MIKNENIKFVDNIPVNEFLALREAVGFQKLSTEQAEKVLASTARVTAAVSEGRYIGVIRVLFDYGTDAYLTDVIVSPDCQGLGLGSMLVKNALDFIRENAFEGVTVACTLYANPGKEPFYEQLGFRRLPDEAKYGYGMLLEI